MNSLEKQIELIRKHFENISEEELNKNLIDCGIEQIKYNYTITMYSEELSNIEMNKFIEKMEDKEDKQWEMEKSQQAYAA